MPRLTPFVLVSILAHTAAVFVAANLLFSRIDALGVSKGLDDRIMVSVIAEEDITAQAETPSAVDSAPMNASEPERADKSESEEKSPKPPMPVTAIKTDKPDADLVDQEDHSQPEPQTEQPQPGPVRSDKETEEETRETTTGEDDPSVSAEVVQYQSKAAPAQIATRETRLKAAMGKDLADFKAGVIAAIKEASYFPRNAARKRQYGRTLVRFRILRDGSISGISVARSSGHAVLDKAAQKIVRNASKKFPRFPERMKTDGLSYLVPIVFKKKGDQGSS